MNRLPAWWPLVGFAGGVVVDAMSPGALPVWGFGLTVFLIGLLMWALPVFSRRACGSTFSKSIAERQRCGVILLLVVGAFFLGAMRHGQFETAYASQLIHRLTADGDRRILKLQGVVADGPTTVLNTDPTRPVWAAEVTTTLLLECRSVVSDDGLVPAGGRVRVSVDGLATHVSAGDLVEVVGLARAPRGPSNPGAFDFRAYAMRQGIVATLRCDRPDAIERVGEASGIINRARRIRGRVRSAATRLLDSCLSESSAGIAKALTLGSRESLDDSLTDAWMRAGTMHVLAISGLHVGIFAGMVAMLLRLLRIRGRRQVAILGLSILLFACFVEIRPSVVRAALLAEVAFAGMLLGRPVNIFNALCVTGLGLLIWSPADLFDTGAQLSFLAAALLCAEMGTPAGRQQSEVDAELLPWWSPTRWAVLPPIRRLMELGRVSLLIWFWSAPLIAARFHLVSWGGAILSPIYIMSATFVVSYGYFCLVVGLILPSFAAAVFIPLDMVLGLADDVTRIVSAIPGSWMMVPNVSAEWLTGWYLLFLLRLFVRVSTPDRTPSQALSGTSEPDRSNRWNRPGRWLQAAVAIWLVGGCAMQWWPQRRDVLTIQFLNVGHGVSVLMDLPDGRLLVYDAGSMSGGRTTARIIRQAVLATGHRRIDQLMISHADFDHFSAVPSLLDEIPIRAVSVTPQFLESGQPSVRILLEQLHGSGVPVHKVQAGSIVLTGENPSAGESLSITVRHPEPATTWANDNASSLVLDVRYGERIVLLTGDLEDDGLRALLDQAPSPVDVLMAPHHGGKRSNTTELAVWAEPDVVVASSGDDTVVDHLNLTFVNAEQVLVTGRDGCVTVSIHADGEFRVTSMLGGK